MFKCPVRSVMTGLPIVIEPALQRILAINKHSYYNLGPKLWCHCIDLFCCCCLIDVSPCVSYIFRSRHIVPHRSACYLHSSVYHVGDENTLKTAPTCIQRIASHSGPCEENCTYEHREDIAFVYCTTWPDTDIHRKASCTQHFHTRMCDGCHITCTEYGTANCERSWLMSSMVTGSWQPRTSCKWPAIPLHGGGLLWWSWFLKRSFSFALRSLCHCWWFAMCNPR